MFDTPQEAALKAENARLRAENDYLRRAVESPIVAVKPWGIEEDVLLPPSAIRPPQINLLKRAGVEGALMDGHRWNVIAWHDRLDGGRMQISYFVDREADRFDDRVFVNHILPKLHERFIRQLSEAYR